MEKATNVSRERKRERGIIVPRHREQQVGYPMCGDVSEIRASGEKNMPPLLPQIWELDGLAQAEKGPIRDRITSTDATLGSRVISKQELDEAAVKNTIGRTNTSIRGESPYISSCNLLITEDRLTCAR